MKIDTFFNKLCAPSYFFLILSAIGIIILMFQNSKHSNKYCVGNFSCNVSSTPGVFIVKVIYILFWTFILDVLCKAGYKQFSWFLVLLPFILYFLNVILFMMYEHNHF